MHWLTYPATMVTMCGRMLEDHEVIQVRMLHATDDTDILRIVLDSERCAWIAEYQHGWAVVAVAPLGSVHTADAVPRAEFYAKPWPDDWLTRWKREPKAVQSRKEAIGLSIGAWVGANTPDAACRLAQVAAVDAEGRPVAFFYTPAERAAGQAVLLAEEPLRWFPIPDKWPQGVERVFKWQTTRQKGLHGGYNFLTKRFGVEQKRADKGGEQKAPGASERKAQRAARAAETRSHAVGEPAAAHPYANDPLFKVREALMAGYLAMVRNGVDTDTANAWLVEEKRKLEETEN